MIKYNIGSLLGVTFFLLPLVSQAADDSRITSISMSSQSETTPATSSDYSFTVVTSSAIAADESITFTIVDGTTVDQSFDFGGATFSSPTISGTSSTPYSFAYSITLDTELATGTHTINLADVINGETAGSEFHWSVTTAATLEAGVDSTNDLESFSLNEDGSVSQLTLLAFGTNIAVSWPDSDLASTYGVILSTAENTTDDVVTDVGANLTYVFTGLVPETTYYVELVGYDVDGGILTSPYGVLSTTTETSLTSTRYTKPTVPKKKIKKAVATVKWVVGDDVDYIESFSLKLKLKDSVAKKYKRISSSTLSKKLQNLKPGKTYTIQIRAKYNTDEKTKWSKEVEFKTDSE